jgi:osmotically-inducible protein OsmY
MAAFATAAEDAPSVQLDPFAQATSGMPACPPGKPPLLTAREARVEAHVRAERGTRCAMEGTCEPGGAYRRDPQINERVRAAIAADARFAGTSVWVTTWHKFVQVGGCVRSAAERQRLVNAIGSVEDVARVVDDLRVGPPPPAKH